MSTQDKLAEALRKLADDWHDALPEITASDCIQTLRDEIEAHAAEFAQPAKRVRQFRVVPKGSVWTDVKDSEIWASVIAHPESYETRILYTHPAPSDAEKRDTMTSHELAKRIERGEKWKLADEPAPCQSQNAERLAEAVRNGLIDALRHQRQIDEDGAEVGVSRQAIDEAAAILSALAAHSAQAQPPAASVPDAVFPSHRACVPYENHPGKRIVGFVIDESHPWWGKCGLTEPLSALEAALAVQESPNGV